jgi:hypothetical protein
MGAGRTTYPGRWGSAWRQGAYVSKWSVTMCNGIRGYGRGVIAYITSAHISCYKCYSFPARATDPLIAVVTYGCDLTGILIVLLPGTAYYVPNLPHRKRFAEC